MTNQQTIVCAFCRGTGNNPHFKGTCPVCKGRGKNEVTGKYMTCGSCHGSGQKGGTTLTCYDCGGLGVVPDTREIFRKAREEIREAQEEMARERPARRIPIQSGEGGKELTEKPIIKMTPASPTKEDEPEEDEKGSCFCQSCAKKINRESTLKVCFACFHKIKEIA